MRRCLIPSAHDLTCALWGTAAFMPSMAQAQLDADLPLPTPTDCAQIGAASDRLTCFDVMTGRARSALPTTPPGEDPPSQLTPKHAAIPTYLKGPDQRSTLSEFWELDPEHKRGLFNLTGYHASYVMPLHYTNRINRDPHSPTQAAVVQPNYRRAEAKVQVSLRTKAIQNFGWPQADLWLAYTQVAMWQVWNGVDSKPFRNTDYAPEAIYVVPTSKTGRPLPWGWQWRYTLVSVAHQSNGQSDPLSRSWNRVELGAGMERNRWTVEGRLSQRFNESLSEDNNPDLVSYRGRGEVRVGWASGPTAALLTYRSTLQDVRFGALQLELSHPVFRDQPNGVRWYAQLFSGFGETLTDYNFRQTSAGLGITFMQF